MIIKFYKSVDPYISNANINVAGGNEMIYLIFPAPICASQGQERVSLLFYTTVLSVSVLMSRSGLVTGE